MGGNQVISPGPGIVFQQGQNAVVHPGAQIGRGVELGNNVVVYPGTVIGDFTVVGDNTVLGKVPRSGVSSKRQVTTPHEPLIIGSNCLIGACVVLYTGTVIGDRVLIADLASIREECRIAEAAIIGRGVLMELRSSIGRRSVIQTGCYITGDMVVEEDVFFGPEVTTTNDKYMGRDSQYVLQGPYVKKRASVGSNATLLPGVVVGEDAVVGAGAVVTRDVADGWVAVGVPAVSVKKINFSAGN